MTEHIFNLGLQISDHFLCLSFSISLAQGGEPLNILFVYLLVYLVLQACEICWALEAQAVEIVEVVPEEVAMASMFHEGWAGSFHLDKQKNTAGLSMLQI